MHAARVILSYYGFEPETNGRAALFDIRIRHGAEQSELTEGLDLLAPDWFGCRVYGGPEVTVAVRCRSRLTIDKHASTAVVTVDEDAASLLKPSHPALFLFLTFALVHALQDRGRYILHGAAVCDEDGQGILMLGESDTGKSTLTMSMIKQGWGYLSDDSLVVTRSDQGIVTTPFRTDFGLDPVAEEFFPGIAEGAEPWLFGGEKWRIRIRELFPSLARPVCRPRMLVFPELDPRAESHLEPMDAGRAIVGLMRQASFLSTDGEHEDARRQIDLFADLVGQCKLCRLVSGEDIVRNAELLSRAFAPRLRGGRWPIHSIAGSSE